MAIDTRVCVGCGACVAACKTENNVPEGLHRDWIVEEVTGKFPNLHMEIRSERCNHCSHAPCVLACPTGASHFVNDTNLVKVTANRCTGCLACLASCPYNARYVMPTGEVSKCTFCDHRHDTEMTTACQTVCPAGAIHFGNPNDPESDVSRLLKSRKYKTLAPGAGTKPNIFFLI